MSSVGVNCDISKNEKKYCQSNPCGENGKCVEVTNNFYCLCDPNWTGRNCNNQSKYLQVIRKTNEKPQLLNTKIIATQYMHCAGWNRRIGDKQ